MRLNFHPGGKNGNQLVPSVASAFDGNCVSFQSFNVDRPTVAPKQHYCYTYGIAWRCVLIYMDCVSGWLRCVLMASR